MFSTPPYFYFFDTSFCDCHGIIYVFLRAFFDVIWVIYLFKQHYGNLNGKINFFHENLNINIFLLDGLCPPWKVLDVRKHLSHLFASMTYPLERNIDKIKFCGNWDIEYRIPGCTFHNYFQFQNSDLRFNFEKFLVMVCFLFVRWDVPLIAGATDQWTTNLKFKCFQIAVRSLKISFWRL